MSPEEYLNDFISDMVVWLAEFYEHYATLIIQDETVREKMTSEEWMETFLVWQREMIEERS